MDINSIITKEEYNNTRQLSYEQFTTYLTKVIKMSVEEALKTLPFVLTHLSSQAAYLKELSDNFYKNNKDLDKHRKIVVREIERAESENPGKKYEEILEIAAVGARRVIAELGRVTDFNPKELERFDSHLGKL